jgi:hypothetical protein
MDAFQSDLIQAGVQGKAMYNDGWYYWSYDAFYESLADPYGGASNVFPDLPISTYDWVGVEVWTCVGGGDYTTRSSGSVEACFCLTDFTQGTGACAQLHVGNDNTFGGASVSFILERRGTADACFYDLGTLYQELPEFLDSGSGPYLLLTNLYAEGGDYTNLGPSDGTLTTDGTQYTTTMANSYYLGSSDDEILLYWENYGAQYCNP